MQKVTVNGVTYLGCLTTNGKTALLSDAMALNTATVSNKNIAEYLRRKNTGTLEPIIRFSGKNIAISESELNVSQLAYLDECLAVMTRAKDQAVRNLENAMFDELLGK